MRWREVKDLGGLEQLRDKLDFPKCLRRFDEGHIRTRFQIATCSVDRSVETFDRASIGTSDDHDVVAARIGGGLDLSDHLCDGNKILTAEMPSAFRRALIFELDRARSSSLKHPDRMGNMENVAKTRISIDDQR